MNWKSAYFKVFSSLIPVYLQHIPTFCFFFLFFYFIGKGEHSHTRTHLCTCNVFPNGSIPSLYSIVDIVFLQWSNFYAATLTSYAFHSNNTAPCGWQHSREVGGTKRHNWKNRDTEQIKFVFSPCILCTMYFTCIMWLQSSYWFASYQWERPTCTLISWIWTVTMAIGDSVRYI